MQDYVIDKCAWHVDAEAEPYKQRALEHFQGMYEVLLEFLREREGLLINSEFGLNIKDWALFEIKTTDLTEKGLRLFKLCHPKWEASYGDEKTKRHLAQWKRRLEEINADE